MKTIHLFTATAALMFTAGIANAQLQQLTLPLAFDAVAAPPTTAVVPKLPAEPPSDCKAIAAKMDDAHGKVFSTLIGMDKEKAWLSSTTKKAGFATCETRIRDYYTARDKIRVIIDDLIEMRAKMLRLNCDPKTSSVQNRNADADITRFAPHRTFAVTVQECASNWVPGSRTPPVALPMPHEPRPPLPGTETPAPVHPPVVDAAATVVNGVVKVPAAPATTGDSIIIKKTGVCYAEYDAWRQAKDNEIKAKAARDAADKAYEAANTSFRANPGNAALKTANDKAFAAKIAASSAYSVASSDLSVAERKLRTCAEAAGPAVAKSFDDVINGAKVAVTE